MVKATHELDAQEKSLLTRKVNDCAQEQLLAEGHAAKAAALKKEIRATMDAGGRVLYETDSAFARIDQKESRKFDDEAVAAIQKIVDPADFKKICPRKVDLKMFDEVVGHHRYDGLEKVPELSTSRSLTIGQLSG